MNSEIEMMLKFRTNSEIEMTLKFRINYKNRDNSYITSKAITNLNNPKRPYH